LGCRFLVEERSEGIAFFILVDVENIYLFLVSDDGGLAQLWFFDAGPEGEESDGEKPAAPNRHVVVLVDYQEVVSPDLVVLDGFL
jgi:hypothetical protein